MESSHISAISFEDAVEEPRVSPFQIESTLLSRNEVHVLDGNSEAKCELPSFDPWNIFDFGEIAKKAFLVD